MKTLTLATFLLLLLAAVAKGEEVQDPRTILARTKEATGGKAWDDVRSLHTRAKASTGGLNGTADSWEDVRTGRFVSTFSLGPVSGAEGYDGKTVWTQDPSGQTRVDDSGDGREGSVNDAYRRSLAYWYPERRQAEISYAGQKTEGDRAFHVLRVTPEGGRPFEMWLDASTFLLDRTVEKRAVETRTTFYSDYREVQGRRFPFVSRSTNGETKYDVHAIIESIEVNPAIDEARFHRPEGKTDDFAIAGDATSATVPFKLLNNHIYVQVRIGDQTLQMLFDTGGMNVLTPATAQRLGLKSEGTLQGRGGGEKSEDIALTHVRELRLGGVVMKDQLFYIFPLAGLAEAEGVQVDGLVGYEMLKRLVGRIEYASERMTFTLPAAFREPAGAAVVPFTFEGQTPQVQGEIDGVAGAFTIDTGSRVSLTLNRPFAEKHGLAARYGSKHEALTGWGVGGGVRSLLARAKILKLGSAEVPAPVVDMALSEKGAFSNPYLAGNVGGGVLKRFDVTFDYGNQKMFLEPNANYAKADNYDRSGLWINREGEGFKVMDVVKEGPAAEAGLKAGDEILSIDGRSAKELGLSETRIRFKDSAPGTRVKLQVRSGEVTRQVALVLRDLA